MTPSPDRRQRLTSDSRLPSWLTIDRALLLGIFSVGMIWGANDLKQAQLIKEVSAMETRVTQQAGAVAAVATENAVLKTELTNMRATLLRIETAVERLNGQIARQR